MPIVVTGATGHLGRLVVENLLERGVPAGEIVAAGRRVETLADLASRGVDVRRLDYSDPDTLKAGLDGARRVLIVSGTEFGQRVAQHTAVAEAARDAGAELLAYTSAPKADSTSMLLADEHRASERAIAAVGLPYTFLRNGWYFENFTDRISTYVEQGAVTGAAGDGLINGAPRADFAAAAAAVLTGDGHENRIYELGADDGFTLSDLARLVAQHTGTAVTYRDVPLAELTALLAGTGLPAAFAAVIADVDRAIGAGELHITSGDLSRLIGRPAGSLDDAVAAAVASSAPLP